MAEMELREYLRPGERVCWQGRTERFPLLDNGTRMRTLGLWIGTTALTGGVLVLYCHLSQRRSMGFIGLVILVAALIATAPFLERRTLLRQKYWITDQRAILMTRDNTFFELELSDIDDFRVVRDLAAEDCLVLGSCMFGEIDRQLRWRACHPKIALCNGGEEDRVMGLICYCVGNAEGAAAQLRRRRGMA